MLKGMGWYYPVLEHSLEFGYKAELLVNVFSAIPPDLADAIKEVLRAFQVLKASATASSGSSSASCDPPAALSVSAAIEDSLWQEREDCGFIRVEWDPATQRRRHVSLNPAFALMRGMHPEEMLARCADREWSLGTVNELDFLCVNLLDILAAAAPRLRRYSRLNSFDCEAVLVRVDSFKLFDAAGRITQVKHYMRRVTAAEFDRAVAAQPDLYSLHRFAPALGPARPGRELLAAADRSVTIAGLAATADGRALLTRLAANVRSIFAPVVAAAGAMVHDLT